MLYFSKIDAEMGQWILAPKKNKDTLPTATETVPTAAETLPTAAEMIPTATIVDAIPTAAEHEERDVIILSEDNHSVLYRTLNEHSAKWREIGIHLGFRPSELDEIQSRPLLLSNASKSWLEAMLAEWLQWTPGDQRRSTSCATLEQLIDVLKDVGLSETAQLIMTLDLTA